ncbi:protease complex subunit PrcB family protein [Comamonas sp. MYb396]|uniref:protease complex subunit PrcB family protein n=1 Tax=Comamonas sp. MYb396 TaxID=2745302 RepID=UPI0030A2FC68
MDAGSSSGIRSAEQITISSKYEWEDLWRRHSEKPIPSVDFEKYFVAAVFLGLRPDSSYGIQILELDKKESQITLKYKDFSRGANERANSRENFALYTQAVVYPYIIIKIKKPQYPILFERVYE